MSGIRCIDLHALPSDYKGFGETGVRASLWSKDHEFDYATTSPGI